MNMKTTGELAARAFSSLNKYRTDLYTFGEIRPYESVDYKDYVELQVTEHLNIIAYLDENDIDCCSIAATYTVTDDECMPIVRICKTATEINLCKKDIESAIKEKVENIKTEVSRIQLACRECMEL